MQNPDVVGKGKVTYRCVKASLDLAIKERCRLPITTNQAREGERPKYVNGAQYARDQIIQRIHEKMPVLRSVRRAALEAMDIVLSSIFLATMNPVIDSKTQEELTQNIWCKLSTKKDLEKMRMRFRSTTVALTVKGDARGCTAEPDAFMSVFVLPLTRAVDPSEAAR